MAKDKFTGKQAAGAASEARNALQKSRTGKHAQASGSVPSHRDEGKGKAKKQK